MRFICCLLFSLFAFNSLAAQFSGTDLTGQYHCVGTDHFDGAFEGDVTLKLNKQQSHGDYAAYDYLLGTSDFGNYLGHGAGHGNQIAIYFAHTDPKRKDFGTALGTAHKNTSNQWVISQYYYEPEYHHGNYGFEECTQVIHPKP
jgi:hypothetical protein